MAIADITTVNKALKIIYPDRQLKFVGYKNNPLLALLPKNEKFLGKQMDIPIWYGGNQGASRTFSTAQSNKTAGLYQNFSLTRKLDYGLTSISNEVIRAGTGPGAFLEVAKGEIDNTVRTVARNYAISLYRNNGGARGQVGSISTTNLTLLNSADVVNFEVGQTIVQDVTDGSSVAKTGAAAAVTITGVDRRAGVLVAAAWTGFTANDFLFRTGDYGLSIHGLDAWIPATTPSGADNFLGVNRSTDTRLYGMFHDGTNQSIEEAIQDLDAKLCTEGATPDFGTMNPKDFNSLRKSLGSSVIFDKAKSPDMASISFETLVLQGLSGRIELVADRNCPAGTVYLLQKDSWEVCSLGPAPQILESMGMRFIWDTTSDSIEARVGMYSNLGCFAPGYNGRAKLY